MSKLAIIITSYNRKEKTLVCLERLFQNTLPEGYSLDVYLVDDGSIDGTEQAIHELYPSVNVIKGDGNLYWNGGMRVAFNVALKKGFDYYLWLNDDTLLYPTAIDSLIKTNHQLTQQEDKPVVVVGATQDEISGKITYGGVIRPSKWKPTNFKLVSTKTVPVKCETMNGNCVLIPNEIAQIVGNLESKLVHAMGDLDYGLRVGYAGYSVWVMPAYAGACSHNPVTGSFIDSRISIIERFKKILQPKALPITSWRVFTQRHAGVFWPIFCVWPYVKVFFKWPINK